ncbi:MAG: hypothetical protein B6243_00475 [Anaerolineaceae bacterium 4572_5.2]|nr:MAG: hypothetical protein B6243_00475 [Anaerolineaceae bacterium 4572_5.2]
MDTITLNGQRFKLVPIIDDDGEEPLSLESLESLVVPYLEYAEYIADKKLSTVTGYERRINQFTGWLKSNHLTAITGQHWIDYYISLKKRKLSAHTVRNHRNDLKVYADWLVANKHISYNPLLPIKPPKAEIDQPLRSISPECMQTMLDHANTPRDYALLMLFKTSGCRKSDIVSRHWIMKWGDMDIDNRRGRVLGKGKKHRPLFFSVETARALQAYRNTLPNTEADQPMWVGKRGPLGITGVYQIFKNIATRAGVKNTCQWNPHAWRHRWARTMDDNEMTTPKLQYLMGHASIETTEVYTRPEAADLQIDYDRHAKFD